MSKMVVMLRWIKQAQFAGFYAAEELGFYRDNCLDVTLVHRESVNYSPVQEVHALNAQVALPWAMNNLDLAEQGLKLTNIAQMFTRPAGRHFVNPNSGITSYDDILTRNRTIVATDREDYAIFKLIKEHNLTACGGILEKACEPGDQIEVNWRGHNIGWFTAEPGSPEYADMGFGMLYNQKALILMSVRGGKLAYKEEDLVELNPEDVLGAIPSEDGIYVQSDWLKDPVNYEAAQRFVKATFEGFIYCREQETACVDIVVDGNDTPELRRHQEWMMHETNKLIWPAARGLGRQDKHNMESLITLAKTLEIIPENSTITPASVSNYALVETVLAELRKEGYDTVGGVFSQAHRAASLRFCMSDSGNILYCNQLNEAESNPLSTVVIVAIGACSALLLVILIVGLSYITRSNQARTSMDSMWKIPMAHLHLSDDILGYGSSGLVVRGEYRGTAVAVKRGLPGGVANNNLFMEPQSAAISETSVGRRMPSAAGLPPTRTATLTIAMSADTFSRSQTTPDVAAVQLGTPRRHTASNGMLMAPSASALSDGQKRTSGDDSSTVPERRNSAEPAGTWMRQLKLLARRRTPDSRKSAEGRSLEAAADAADSLERGEAPNTSPRSITPLSQYGGRLRLRKSFASALGPKRKSGSGVEGTPARHSADMEAYSRSASTQRLLRIKAFEEEMRLMVHLRHPNIVTVMGAVMGEDPLLVMECMENGSLRDLLLNETFVLEPQILLSLLTDVASGLKFLHMANPPIVHSDIKASNVLVDRNLRAKVCDFGLSTKRKPGIIAGTPAFISPEVLRGQQSTTASDVYSFAMTMFEVVSREEVYLGEDPMVVMKEVSDPLINGMRRPKLTDRFPKPLATLIRRCWDDDPEARPTVAEILDELHVMGESGFETDWQLYSQQNMLSGMDGQSSDELLHQILPRHVANALKAGEKVEPESFPSVTIFFSDIVGFTNICSQLKAEEVMDMLDRLYHCFDDLTKSHDLFKVETIGDAYMVVGGLHMKQPDHAARVARFALALCKAANQVPISTSRPELGNIQIRAGLHSGPVVASVVGNLNPRYCLFGDTVNTSSRMESTSAANQVQCSRQSALRIQRVDPGVELESRGVVNVKGKHRMETFWVRGTTCPPPLVSPFQLYESMEDIDYRSSTLSIALPDGLNETSARSEGDATVPLAASAHEPAHRSSADIRHDLPDPGR
eukprot:jgi/Tetstr1/433206/TSEL_022494.t1